MLFAAWRPSTKTVQKLMERHLIPPSFLETELDKFCRCWAMPSVAYSEVLDPGERLYKYTPKAGRKVWNLRFARWAVAAWQSALDPYLTHPVKEVRGSDRVWLSEYTKMLERCLADPIWLKETADWLFRKTKWRDTQ